MIPGEQPDLSALPPETSPVKRRLAAQHVRDARDRLTSSSGTRPHFDYELLRQYAQNRLSASLVILLLVATIGFLSSLWTDAVAAGAWTASVLVIHAVIITKCRQFLAQPMSAISAKAWRLRFILLDLFYGLAWMFILIHPVGTDESSNTFMLFVMLLVVAVSSMLASSLPIAAFAATFPVTAAIALDFALHQRLNGQRRLADAGLVFAPLQVGPEHVVPGRHHIAAVDGHWNPRRIGKDKAYRRAAAQVELGNQRREVVAIGAQAVQPDHAGAGIGSAGFFDAAQVLGHGRGSGRGGAAGSGSVGCRLRLNG